MFTHDPAMLKRPERRLAGLRSCRIAPRHDVWALQLNSRFYEERVNSSASTLFFPVLEEAIRYAERHGLAYRIQGVSSSAARKRRRSAPPPR
jgi:hypothetical protein